MFGRVVDMKYSEHLMICNSTQNQTVNLLPALQFEVRRVFLVSTPHADKNGYTSRFKTVAERHGMEVQSVLLTTDQEKDITAIQEILRNKVNGEDRIIWNITGGQKIPSIPFYLMFQARVENGFHDDKLLYIEGNRPETWLYGTGNKPDKIKSSACIPLDDILYLYGSEAVSSTRIYPNPDEEARKHLKIGRQALEFYGGYKTFREAFFAYMKPNPADSRNFAEMREILRKSLEKLKPNLRQIKIDLKGYEELENSFKKLWSRIGSARDLTNLKGTLNRLKIIEKPDEIFKNYWNQIKTKAIEHTLASIDREKQPLTGSIPKVQAEELAGQIRAIGGVTTIADDGRLYKEDTRRFSGLKSNGALFEWMVAAAVIETFEKKPDAYDQVSEIHLECTTKKLGEPDVKPDSELDLVITTKFGTLLVFEMKTYEFSGDTAKSKESTAYKKSGPYGKAIIVGPLLRNMQNDDGAFPSYIDTKVIDQRQTADQNGIEYLLLDEVEGSILRKLHVER